MRSEPLKAHSRVWALSRLLTVALLVTAGLARVPPAIAQSADDIVALRAEIEALKQGQATIQKELLEIKQLIIQQRPQMQARRQPTPFAPTAVSVASAPSLGDVNAPVAMIEFTDYQCPYCRRYNLQTKPQIVKEYVDTGKLRYILHEFPLASIHPYAAKAAEAALCAGDQGKYWEMGTHLFQNQSQLQPDQLSQHAEALHLDLAIFEECLRSNKYAKRVRDDSRVGAAVGITGTPTFLLGQTDPDHPDQITATKMVIGAQPYEAFKKAIDDLISEAGRRS